MVYALGVIPARAASTRFPLKILAPILGRPMIQHVWDACTRCILLNQIVVATDDEAIKRTVEDFGGRAIMTPIHLESGTDRVAWAARTFEADIIVNIQGDEPLIQPFVIDQLVSALVDTQADMATLCVPANTLTDGNNPNVVKVTRDTNGLATGFSRTLGTNYSDRFFLKHIGIYAYRRAALYKFCDLSMTTSEKTEKLEQLRALENGMKIQVIEIAEDTVAVDVPEDVARVESRLKEMR